MKKDISKEQFEKFSKSIGKITTLKRIRNRKFEIKKFPKKKFPSKKFEFFLSLF